MTVESVQKGEKKFTKKGRSPTTYLKAEIKDWKGEENQCERKYKLEIIREAWKKESVRKTQNYGRKKN